MLEFVIWMLYGPDGLTAFNQSLFHDGTFQSFYSTTTGRLGNWKAKVHPAVQLWMRHILKNPDWPQGTIIGDLVTFIEAHLLVISVEGGPEDNPSRPHRADAKTLYEHLSRILNNSETNREYLFPQAARARRERPTIPDCSNQLEALDPPQSSLVPPQRDFDLPRRALEPGTLEAPDVVVVRPPTPQPP